jgi:mannose-6-phosphate isomerase-like protein (cupin superfamily)
MEVQKMKENIKRGLEDAKRLGDVVSGDGFNCGKGHMDVAVILGTDPDCPVPGHPDDFDSSMLFCNWCSLDAGAVCGMHPHLTAEEYYYVIKGKGKMTIEYPDGTLNEYEVGPNEAILMHAGNKHQFETISEEPCEFLAVCAGVPDMNCWSDEKFAAKNKPSK